MAGSTASVSMVELSRCRFGAFAKELKGEDGVRVERFTVGEDSILAALLCDGHGGHGGRR